MTKLSQQATPWLVGLLSVGLFVGLWEASERLGASTLALASIAVPASAQHSGHGAAPTKPEAAHPAKPAPRDSM